MYVTFVCGPVNNQTEPCDALKSQKNAVGMHMKSFFSEMSGDMKKDYSECTYI